MEDRIKEINFELEEINSKIKISKNRIDWLKDAIIQKQDELDNTKFDDLLFIFNMFKRGEINKLEEKKEQYKKDLTDERKVKWELENSKENLEMEKKDLYNRLMNETLKKDDKEKDKDKYIDREIDIN